MSSFVEGLLDKKKQAELDLAKLQDGISKVDAENLGRLLRVIPSRVRYRHYGEYYSHHRDVLFQLERAWLAGDHRDYFDLHDKDWQFYALDAVKRRIFPSNAGRRTLNEHSPEECALFDKLLVETRTSHPSSDMMVKDDIEWGELLDHFNIHRTHSYMTWQERAEFAALVENLVIYIGWNRDDASEFAQVWTLDYDQAEADANQRANGDVFMTIFPKQKAKGYISRNGRQEVIIAWTDIDMDALEPYKGPVPHKGPLPDSDPLES